MTVVPQRIDYHEGDLVNGLYRVEKALGEGAFGIVYKVTDQNRNVRALKLLRLWDVPADIRQPLVDRFTMEFKTGQIESRYLVHSYDYGLANGNPFIVMEFCPGGDMTKVVGRTDVNMVQYAANVLHGLHDLHVNGKVHRDLKPENVLFREDGTAVLTDFGICGDRNKRMTERNIFGKPYQMFGTYAYMPPEQVNRARGEATVLPTTDIFSFGVMLYQLLTGRLPFGPLEDQNDLVRYQKRGKAGDWDYNAILGLTSGESWYRIIEGCLKPDFKVRTQSAKQVMIMLSQIPNMGGSNIKSASVAVSHTSVLTDSLINRTPSKTFSKSDPQGVQLRILQGEEFGRVMDISKVASQLHRMMLTMGRHSSNILPVTELQSSYLSRFHCTLESDPQYKTWKIRDGQWRADERCWRESSNGTYVNSSRVSTSGFFLAPGDIITIGDVKIRVEEY